MDPHTSVLFWGSLPSKNQEGSCLPAAHLAEITEFLGRWGTNKLYHVTIERLPLESVPGDTKSQSRRLVPYSPCTTLPGYTEGHSTGLSPESVGTEGVGSKGDGNNPGSWGLGWEGNKDSTHLLGPSPLLTGHMGPEARTSSLRLLHRALSTIEGGQLMSEERDTRHG